MSIPTTIPDFNPSKDERVDHIKESIEAVIDYIRHMPGKAGDARCVAIACTKLEEASMWAVKSLFVDALR